jgi:hypothetical protein
MCSNRLAARGVGRLTNRLTASAPDQCGFAWVWWCSLSAAVALIAEDPALGLPEPLRKSLVLGPQAKRAVAPALDKLVGTRHAGLCSVMRFGEDIAAQSSQAMSLPLVATV